MGSPTIEEAMNLRNLLTWAEGDGQLVEVSGPVDPHLEMARAIHALEGRAVLFADPRRSDWRICPASFHAWLGPSIAPSSRLLALKRLASKLWIMRRT